MIFYAILLTPLLGIILFSFIRKARWAVSINLFISTVNFIAMILLLMRWQTTPSFFILHAHEQLYLDALGLIGWTLTTFIGMTTALFSYGYMLQNLQERRITLKRLQLYHLFYQSFIFSLLIAFSANNIGLLWVAIEGATLATVLLVSLYRTPEAIEAAWKYFIICIVGIALALFGTILIYFAAQTSLDPSHAILWNALALHAKTLNPSIMILAFVFLFVGYGTKAGLVPFHFWLPDAYSESPGPVAALLSGLLLNVALYALLRFQILTNLSLQNGLANHLMIVFGLLSFVFASLTLHHQQNIKRMFSYSSIEHVGIMTFAFGLGNAVAILSGLFYLVIHALIKSAIFTTVGNVMHLTHTQKIEKIRGLLKLNPWVGWLLIVALFAIAGAPPFGLFIGEVGVFLATLQTDPYLAIILGLGFLVVFAALLRYMQSMALGNPDKTAYPTPPIAKINLVPAGLHLLIVLILGLYIPSFFMQILKQAASLFTGQ